MEFAAGMIFGFILMVIIHTILVRRKRRRELQEAYIPPANSGLDLGRKNFKEDK